jgi:hypothetical protein
VSGGGLEKAFQEALPKALRLLELTEEFLKQKEAERSAYWNTPERKAEREARWAENQGKVRKIKRGLAIQMPLQTVPEACAIPRASSLPGKSTPG